MFLQNKESGTMIKVVELDDLFNPVDNTIQGQIQNGEEEQPPESFKKEDLVFPSGESLPLCWLDSDYRSKNSL